MDVEYTVAAMKHHFEGSQYLPIDYNTLLELIDAPTQPCAFIMDDNNTNNTNTQNGQINFQAFHDLNNNVADPSSFLWQNNPQPTFQQFPSFHPFYNQHLQLQQQSQSQQQQPFQFQQQEEIPQEQGLQFHQEHVEEEKMAMPAAQSGQWVFVNETTTAGLAENRFSFNVPTDVILSSSTPVLFNLSNNDNKSNNKNKANSGLTSSSVDSQPLSASFRLTPAPVQATLFASSTVSAPLSPLYIPSLASESFPTSSTSSMTSSSSPSSISPPTATISPPSSSLPSPVSVPPSPPSPPSSSVTTPSPPEAAAPATAAARNGTRQKPLRFLGPLRSINKPAPWKQYALKWNMKSGAPEDQQS
eukprot:TRINITY_DN306_c0_g1_i3.p1 TRINITY_DN306_c0_g1~~TRINITY_DN306_c0_g1_i3.p1  ORF type:complete len:359 (-),score=195.97 TRINITY_DN306_c0_g1_i3:260-1336(-)